MRTTLFLFMSLVLGACVSRSDAAGREAPGGSATIDGRKARPTPAIIAKAEELLRENEREPVGTEIPVTIDGKPYVARIEEHDNTTNDPGRPRGKHKGVTVYERQ